jgi:hypothetical protein
MVKNTDRSANLMYDLLNDRHILRKLDYVGGLR